jgi:NADPH-dependent 2,4-dienoyl-CoA reductase/sulfur reductase-like enzyme/rhodanese-related sulfurtransferase
MKIVIVGGVAGGASAAARARRLGEDSEIVLFERGEHPSFANCGLPYYVGGKIESRDRLLVAPTERLRQRYDLDVRTRSEITAINRDAKTVTVQPLDGGEVYEESYDKLILAMGAKPVRPPLPGIDSERVLELRDLNDADVMHHWATSGTRRAVIVGGGFIGIEVAENLVRRGIHVTVVERDGQILPPWDHEMVTSVQDHVRDQGVELMLEDSVVRFEESGNKLLVELESGRKLDCEFAVLSIGVRPASELASEAGIECGPRGGILTNAHMQTNDPDIYAVGDVVQVSDFVSGQPTQIPLAGPANRQGRIAADHIFGRKSEFRGTQGTSIVGVFGKTVALTGQSEKQLQRNGLRYEKIYIHPSDHAGYYPGSQSMTVKLLFDPDSGRILGGQAFGGDGVDKRIDVIAVAIQAGMTVEDLEEVELCYAPQYGHAKDPVNMAGFVASGVIRGDHPVHHHHDLFGESVETPFVLDVRTEKEFAAGHIDSAVNIPLEELRQRLDELPRDRKIVAYCKVGQRGYMATRILLQAGFDVANLTGGYTSWGHYPDSAKRSPASTES